MAGRGKGERGKTDWADLPTEVLSVIFSRLGVAALLQSADPVCRAWRQVSLDPHFYLSIHIVSNGVDAIRMENLARKATRRSAGLAKNFFIMNCGTGGLLTYIAHHTSGLKRIVMVMPRSITGSGIARFVRKCPLLEECLITCLSAGFVARGDIGQVCPEMKSFRLSRQLSMLDHCAEMNEVREIADCMPQLRTLRLPESLIDPEELHA